MQKFTIEFLMEIIGVSSYEELVKRNIEDMINHFNSLSDEALIKILEKVYESSYPESGEEHWVEFLAIQKIIIEILNKRGVKIPANPFKH